MLFYLEPFDIPCSMDFISTSGHHEHFKNAYTNANQAGGPVDRCSIDRSCFLLRDHIISWCNNKKTIADFSNMKAEYRALTNTTMELLCLLLILKDIGVERFNVALNHYNNQSVIQIAYNV